ncbi:MAG: sigma-54 dependent transcriptional regulator [Rhodobacteraceae bacterium]|jgi:DNA-binding NtrC family response regulator|nr:sigma-54 dependent transcriptional regulator [Paracoccaceae bacterium]
MTAERTSSLNTISLKNASILVVDDEEGMRHFITKVLEPHCKRVMQAASAKEAGALMDIHHFDLLMVDNLMPEQTGLDWLSEQRKLGLFADAIMMTAYADVETAVLALRTGVADFLIKPFRASQVVNAIASVLDKKYLRRDNDLLRYALAAETQQNNPRLLGTSVAIAGVSDLLKKLAGVKTPVLFTGESGTGKEIAARTLHAMSDRRAKPFVAVNCATLGAENGADQLFGKLGPTGEVQEGLMQLADGGVLFLDEVAELPDPIQAMLLRVLEDYKMRPISAARDVALDLRFMFATNMDLEQAVANGKFRRDLFHRMNIVGVKMPPLRERREDIFELASMFMNQFSVDVGRQPLRLDDETLLHLTRHNWPGNVRELRNMIERSVILGAFPPEFQGGGQADGAVAAESLDLVVQRHILTTLDRCNGNRAETARRLGVSRKTIDRKMMEWGDDVLSPKT